MLHSIQILGIWVGAIGLINSLLMTTVVQATPPQSFFAWCQQRNSLPSDSRATVTGDE
jgi:hypothetical protein